MKYVVTAFVSLLLILPLYPSVLIGASAPPPADGSAVQLIESLGCRGCHRIQGYGGSLAGDLTGVGSRMTMTEITEFLSTHPRPDERQLMPSYATLSSEEIDTLSTYLYNLH